MACQSVCGAQAGRSGERGADEPLDGVRGRDRTTGLAESLSDLRGTGAHCHRIPDR